VIVRNHTPFWSNIQCRGGIYLAIIERRLWRRDKNVGVESNLLNDLGFNLYVAPQSLVMRLVAYFRVKEVVKTEAVRATRGKTPGDSSVNYNLCDIVTTYLQEIPQRIR